ncbi:hypothetical protein I5907_06570 [Panacibacter sp. DH6]|uniref:Uncharacterized protein n=1 Tax=Panacibacter microcysteis TaxID=2793269 RepID=A0A931E5Z1_9BACT|nr:hypothetical protein [Panacibacter microcysteis]MBG9375890.1 hypothetical protein [Panacibacter microcysteis]
MYKKRIALLLSCFVVFNCYTYAQQFGGNPASVKWKQVNTDTLRVIFPVGLDSVAQRVANVTHTLQKNYTTGIGAKINKVNIVLQKDVTISNAFVQLGPYRSEYYLMPPQDVFDLGAQGWADNLSIHEYRHVQQYSNFNVGLSKVFSVLFGQYGQSIANASAVPDWFFEGDAVYNETKFSIQGRGRLPLFLNTYKSLDADGKDYKFMQMRNGSLRHYIPGHYELGYLLTAYGKEKYGEDFWQKVTHDAAAFKPLFYPMQGAVKKYAGVSYRTFVHNAMSYYRQQWEKDTGYQAPQWLTGIKKNDVLNYQYPYYTEDGNLVVLKTSRERIPAFYIIDKAKNERKLAVRDIAYDGYFSYNNNKIVYSVLQPDVRWGNRNYSVIKILDINSCTETKITHHTKYFSPDIAHSGAFVAAASFTPEQQSKLVLLRVDGTAVSSFAAPANHVISYPKFSADDKTIFFIERNAKGEMALQQLSEKNTISTIIPFANRLLGFPVVKGDTLLYTCSSNGHDEIFAYITTTHKHYRLASYKTGLYQATTDNSGNLVTAVFTSDGYRLGAFKPGWQPAGVQSDTITPLYVTAPFNVQDNNLLANLPARTFATAKYPKFYKPFNFHSWIPSFTDPDYSYTIYGENVLNTLQSQLYYTYNTNEQYHRVGFTTAFGGWYVQPFLDVNNIFNRRGTVDDSIPVRWNELLASAGLRLPLNLGGGKQYRSLTLSASYNVNNINWKSDTKQLLKDINYIRAGITYTAQVQKAAKQIYPHWAQNLSVVYRASASAVAAQQLLATGNLYLPGLGATHSLVINAAYQARDTMQQYAFTNSFPYSRGYNAFNYPHMYKLGVNYHFPIVYPDWGFGNIIYFTRIRANAFYDYTNLRSLRENRNYQLKSFGAELFFDTRWWNQQPLQFGIRYSRLIDYTIAGQQPNRWEIVLPVTLIN